MQKSVREIATVQTGIFLRPTRAGSVAYLQARDFDEHGDVNIRLNVGIEMEGRTSRHLLRDEDILFAAKGTRNTSAVYRSSFGPAVASSTFVVLRISDEMKPKILPEYLSWFINHPHSQKKLKSVATGTSVPAISLNAMAQLDVDIPDLQLQQIILDVDRLRNRERRLTSEIDLLKHQLLDTKLLICAKHKDS